MAAKRDEVPARAYQLERYRAAREATLPLRNLPHDCPYDRSEIMEAECSLEEN